MTYTGTIDELLSGDTVDGATVLGWAQALEALTDPWTPFVPTWSSSGTAVSLGNGTCTGAYMRTGKLVTGRITLTMGTTTTFGTGNYSVTLPVGMAGAAWDSFGSLSVRDASASASYSYGAFSISTASVSGGSNGSLRWGPTNPITFATGDIVTICFEYEAA